MTRPHSVCPPEIRAQGADPGKLARQIARSGDSLDGMPPRELTRGRGGRQRIHDGVTRATRAAKQQPGQLVAVEVIATLPNLDATRTPRAGETLP